MLLGQVKRKPHVSRPDFYKKRSGRVVFLVIYYFLLHAFFTHYYLHPREGLIVKIYIIYKGLTVKIYIILVCTQQQWALQVTPVGFCS